MKKRIVWLVVATALGGCGDDLTASHSEGESTTSESQENAAQAAEAAAAEEARAAEAAQPPASNIRDVHGLEVTLNEDGTIALRGVDRWGGQLDTLYADAEYFGTAVPVLGRSVTDEQLAGLQEILTELTGETPTAPPGSESTPTP